MGTVFKRTPQGKYYGEYTDPHGKRVRRSTGTTVKKDAETILRQWETEANNSRHGISSSGTVTLEELITEYVNYLANTGEGHRETTEQRIRRIVDANGWTRPNHINQLAVETVVRTFTSLAGKRDRTELLSLRSQGHYLTAMKGFSSWLVRLRHALIRDPLEAVRKPSFAHDRRKIRRYLLHEEWTWLSKTKNALLYETAIQTGFRNSELRNLRPSDIRDDHLHLSAKYTKNKQVAKQFIPADLRDRIKGALPFDMPSKELVAQMLRDDLAWAREQWLAAKNTEPDDFLAPINSAGHELDFHALRHTCGAWLAIAGVNVKVIQSVMRHSTITLTLDCYGHMLPGAESSASDLLGTLLQQHR